jgi:outer membrane protein
VSGPLRIARGLASFPAIGFLPTACSPATMRAAERRPHKGSLVSSGLPSVSIQAVASSPIWHHGCTGMVASDNMNSSTSKRHPTSVHSSCRRILRPNRLFLLFAILVCASPNRSLAQDTASDGAQAPLLTLNGAVSLALANNRLVKNSALEAQSYDPQVRSARSKRLPEFNFSMLGGELLQPFDFTFQKGVFGTYPGVGPIPGSNAKVHTPAVFTTYMTGSMDQPITQQYKIGLGIHLAKLGRDIAREDVRAERQKIAAEVRNAYFNLVATQAGVDAAREAVQTLEEAQRVTVQYVAEKTVLRGDALEVDAQLAKARYDLSVAQNGLATQQENLNELLGRDIATPFRVEYMPEEDTTDLSLETARQQALTNRPEVRESELKEKQAEYARRLAKAQYIPDLSLDVRYQGIHNVQVLPQNVETAGFLLTWEPFDWGRRHNKVVEKTIAIEQARNGVQETESQVAVEVGAKYRKWQEASLLLKASETAHEAAVEQLRTTVNKYKVQAALLKDLLAAQAQSSETTYEYQQSLASYWSALADLRKAMGEE